eukprot:gnl/TRDRNA2_/TRDRNA2_200684_c0_seq1.p1 gnl/TRDRNA2_/TRDRNA2_200684_c0~~gnl/TRDRNA2_/TRDRNA2_200684_c0_seq1.p1  ORF type:complete len:417 (-),score=59.92 gnl/TRDRNA2_/TRDRNA2_200684_c0_seq1:90-1304(-)
MAAAVGISSCTVYAGSNLGDSIEYSKAAKTFGGLLAQHGVDLVYGGGKRGLMGALADGALASGGRVIGVITGFLKEKEVAHLGLTRLDVVEDMKQRKRLLFEGGSVIVALPGGIGTFEELVEALVLSRWGGQPKLIGVLNLDGIYTPLLELLQRAADHGFVDEHTCRKLLVVSETPEDLFDRLAAGVADTGAFAEAIRALPGADAQSPPPPLDSCTVCLGAMATQGAVENDIVRERHVIAARELGELLAHEGVQVAYDGRQSGLQGAMTTAALASGGRVVGVPWVGVPCTGGYCAWKHRLLQRGHWLVALPGDLIVFDFLLDALSAVQLKTRVRPLGLLNVGGYYTPLLRWLECACDHGFVQREHLTYIVHAESPKELIEKLRCYAPTISEKNALAAELPSSKL